ncbi:MAG: DEAD/DEAH box helicase [Lachnospiraceae bacterium]
MTEENLKYEDSGIDPRILRAVSEMGYEQMTPIQEQAIPKLMEGRDVIGQAQTGTGKTAAFGIPMLQRMDAGSRELQGMILCPTRELAIQAAEELHKFSKYMHGIRVVPIYGGQDISRQIKALKGGAQIIVGTPGRVMDHMRRHTIKPDGLKMVVLDEADEMLNMGFREDMETILGEIRYPHQTALFSATMPQAILDITHKYQKDAVAVRITKKELTIPLVKQYYYVVKNIYKEEAVSRLLDTYGLKRSIIFCNTKKMVDELSEKLKKRGYQAEGLHGDMTQKQRDFVMNRFKSGNLQILIATDVAARGIDVDDLEAVFNYDVPQDTEYYVHRIGRTGRAGREGLAFTFAYGRDLYRIREIERVCRTKMTEQKLPKSRQVMEIKLNQLLRTAQEEIEKSDLTKLQDQIEEKLSDYEIDPMELLTWLVKNCIGETPQEIVMEEPRKKKYKTVRADRTVHPDRVPYGKYENKRSKRSK